jgi:hypothetical protein
METLSRTRRTQTNRSSHYSPLLAHASVLQRKTCACGGTPGLDGECAACRQKRLSLQRRSANGSTSATVPPIVHEVLRSSGQSLDAGTRAFMESRFGYDFGQVRVHTDAKAAESARTVQARAYTVGRDVAFGGRQYAPETAVGRRLLAHELAHVVQQESGPSTASDVRSVIALDPSEREAEKVSAQIATGTPVADLTEGRGVLIQRQPVSEPHLSRRHPGQPLPYHEAIEEMAREQLSGTSPAQPLPQALTRTAAGTAGVHRGVHYRVYETSVRAGGSRAWLNNNPGNLVYGQLAQANGAIGSDGRFAIFPDDAIGMDALLALLRTGTYQALTVRDAMLRYAPPSENKTADYIEFIRRQTGLDPGLRMSDLTDTQLMALTRGIRTFEGWIPGDIYTCNTAAAPDWVRNLLGCQTPDPNNAREPKPQTESPGIPVPNRDNPSDTIHE